MPKSKNTLKNTPDFTEFKEELPDDFCGNSIPINLTINYLHSRKGDFLGIQIWAEELGTPGFSVKALTEIFDNEDELLSELPTLEDVLEFFSMSSNWAAFDGEERAIFVNNISGNYGLFDLTEKSPFYIFD